MDGRLTGRRHSLGCGALKFGLLLDNCEGLVDTEVSYQSNPWGTLLVPYHVVITIT